MVIKNMKLAHLGMLGFAILFSIFLTIPTYSVALTDGGVGSIINIIVESDNNLVSQVPDLRTYSTPIDGSVIARVYVDNNDIHGFGVTLESERFGQLDWYDGGYPSVLNDGHFIPYSINLEKGVGSWGVDFPDTTEVEGIDLDTQHEVFFDDNVIQATEAGEIIVKMRTSAKLSLFHGMYRDVITYTIRDL
ncbi:MAG: hypothetical protein O3A01_06960 [bacterium]|nr:hypothetical protein [bacterium]